MAAANQNAIGNGQLLRLESAGTLHGAHDGGSVKPRRHAALELLSQLNDLDDDDEDGAPRLRIPSPSRTRQASRVSISSATSPGSGGASDGFSRTVPRAVASALGTLRRMVRASSFRRSPSSCADDENGDDAACIASPVDADRGADASGCDSPIISRPRNFSSIGDGFSCDDASGSAPRAERPATAPRPSFAGNTYAAGSQRLRASIASPGLNNSSLAGALATSGFDLPLAPPPPLMPHAPVTPAAGLLTTQAGIHLQGQHDLPDVHARLAASLLAAAEVDAEAIDALRVVREWTKGSTRAHWKPSLTTSGADRPKSAPLVRPSIKRVQHLARVEAQTSAHAHAVPALPVATSADQSRKQLANRRAVSVAKQVAAHVEGLPNSPVLQMPQADTARTASGGMWVGGAYSGRRAPARPSVPGTAAVDFVKRLMRHGHQGHRLLIPEDALRDAEDDEGGTGSACCNPNAVQRTPSVSAHQLVPRTSLSPHTEQLHALHTSSVAAQTPQVSSWGASPRRDPRLAMAGWAHAPHTRIAGPAAANIPVLPNAAQPSIVAPAMTALARLLLLDLEWDSSLAQSGEIDAHALLSLLRSYADAAHASAAGRHATSPLMTPHAGISAHSECGDGGGRFGTAGPALQPVQYEFESSSPTLTSPLHRELARHRRHSLEMDQLRAALQLVGAPGMPCLPLSTDMTAQQSRAAAPQEQQCSDLSVDQSVAAVLAEPSAWGTRRPESSRARAHAAASTARGGASHTSSYQSDENTMMQQRVALAQRQGFAVLWSDPAAAASTAPSLGDDLSAGPPMVDIMRGTPFPESALSTRRIWHASMRVSWRLHQVRTNPLVRLTLQDRVQQARDLTQARPRTASPRPSRATGLISPGLRAAEGDNGTAAHEPARKVQRTADIASQHAAVMQAQRARRIQHAARHYVYAALRLRQEQQACWATVIALCMTSTHIVRSIKGARLQRVNIAAVLFIQRMWRGFRERLYARRLRAAVMRLKRWLLRYRMKYMLRAKRRAAALVLQFTREMVCGTNTTAVRAAARRLVHRVVKLQRCVRRYLQLQRARMQLLILWWRETQEQQRALVQWRAQQAKLDAMPRPRSGGSPRQEGTPAGVGAAATTVAPGHNMTRRNSVTVPALRIPAAGSTDHGVDHGVPRGSSGSRVPSHRAGPVRDVTLTAGAARPVDGFRAQRRGSAPAMLLEAAAALARSTTASAAHPAIELPASDERDGAVRKPISGMRARAAMRAAVWTIAGVRNIASGDAATRDRGDDSDVEMDAVWLGLGLPTLQGATGAADGPAAPGHPSSGLRKAPVSTVPTSGRWAGDATAQRGSAAATSFLASMRQPSAGRRKQGFASLPAGARRASHVLLRAALADDVILSPAMAGMTSLQPETAAGDTITLGQRESAVERVVEALQKERLHDVDVATRNEVLKAYLQRRLREYARRVAKLRQLRNLELAERQRAAEQAALERRARAAAARAARRASISAAKAATAAASGSAASKPSLFIVRTLLDNHVERSPGAVAAAVPSATPSQSSEPASGFVSSVFLTLTESDAAAAAGPSRVSSVADLMDVRQGEDADVRALAAGASPPSFRHGGIRRLRDDPRARVMQYDYTTRYPPLRLISAAGSRAMAKLLVMAKYKSNAHLDLLANVSAAVSKQLEAAARRPPAFAVKVEPEEPSPRSSRDKKTPRSPGRPRRPSPRKFHSPRADKSAASSHMQVDPPSIRSPPPPPPPPSPRPGPRVAVTGVTAPLPPPRAPASAAPTGSITSPRLRRITELTNAPAPVMPRISIGSEIAFHGTQ